jgi:hypothetical protein
MIEFAAGVMVGILIYRWADQMNEDAEDSNGGK